MRQPGAMTTTQLHRLGLLSGGTQTHQRHLLPPPTLFHTLSVGMFCTPSSSSTRFTASICGQRRAAKRGERAAGSEDRQGAWGSCCMESQQRARLMASKRARSVTSQRQQLESNRRQSQDSPRPTREHTCAGALGWLTSTTCSSSEASWISSRVARKAATSCSSMGENKQQCGRESHMPVGGQAQQRRSHGSTLQQESTLQIEQRKTQAANQTAAAPGWAASG